MSAPPLDGVRVIDLTNYVAGPLASMTLGDLGADVLKIEQPLKGDAMRTFGARRRGTSLSWVNVNRNKRSRRLDLKSADGRDALLELVEAADIFVCNWRAGVAESLGLGDSTLAETTPRLIRCYITGFGSTGPMARRPAFDGLLQATSALAAIQGGREAPALVRTIVADKTTAAVATQSVLAALYRRERTGEGTRIDLAMIDTMAWFLFSDTMKHRIFVDADEGERPVPDDSRQRSTIIATSDGHIVIAPVSGAQIGRACDALGHPEWKADLKAIADPNKPANPLLDLAESVTIGDTTSHWCEVFEQADVPAAPVL